MISLDEVKNLVKLAHLTLTSNNLKKLQNDLAHVLTYVEVLEQAHTRKEPISHITGLTNITRPDQAMIQSQSNGQELIEAFSLKHGRWLKVSKILDKDAS